MRKWWQKAIIVPVLGLSILGVCCFSLAQTGHAKVDGIPANDYPNFVTVDKTYSMFTKALTVANCYSFVGSQDNHDVHYNISVETDAAKINSGQLFYDSGGNPNRAWLNGRAVDDYGFAKSCVGTSFGNSLASEFGMELGTQINGPTQFVCQMGYQFQNGTAKENLSTCMQRIAVSHDRIKSGGGFSNTTAAGQAARDAIKAITGLDISSPANKTITAAGLYHRYYTELAVSKCASGGSVAQNANSTQQFSVKTIQNGVWAEQYYNKISTYNDAWGFTVAGTAEVIGCDTIIQRANAWADTYWGQVQTDAGNMCKSLGFSDSMTTMSAAGQPDFYIFASCRTGALDKLLGQDLASACTAGKLSSFDGTDPGVADGSPAGQERVDACTSGFNGTLTISDTTTQPDAGGDGGQPDVCEEKVGGFGWIICTVIYKVGEAIQDIFQDVLNILFRYDGATNPALLSAWQALLPIANIIFVIVFMIIIYSTATSTGMSNYTIKKILPRLVIGVILVNISFYICAAMADLSNIVGAYIGDTIANGSGNIAATVPSIAPAALATVGIIIVVAIAWPTILLSLVLIMVLVVLRDVLLTLLIVISPIAFALWLLPNTKRWFDMWLKEYTRMLIVYPAISAVFGACMLASAVIGETQNAVFATIMKAILILVPVVAILPIMKMGGQAMARLQGMVQKGINRAGGDALRKNQQERVKDWGGRRIAGVKNRMRRGVETASNEVEAAQKSLATAQGNRARAATKFGENEQKELAGLAALVVRNRAQQERFDELTGFQNEANVADREVKTAENNLAAKQQAHKDKLRGRGYRLAFYNDMVRAQRSERERQQKAQSMRALGDRIGLEAGQGESSSWMRSYTGMGKAEKSRALGAREDAYNTQTEIEDKESSERTQRELSRLGNFKIDDNGIDRVLSNEEIADLLTGKRASITGKIGDRTITIGGEELAGNRNQKLAMIKTLQDHGWASSEVLKVQDAIAKQSDGYVRQAMQDAVAQSGKAESWYAGGAIPGVSNGKVRSVEDGVVYSTQGGIKGDIFGASVGGNQTVKMAEAIRRMAAARPAAGTAQANAIQQTGAYIESQLNSNNGGNVINSDPKAADVYSMLQSANRSEADIAAMFKRAGMSNARFAQVQAMAAQRTTEGRNLNLSLYN